ncbi:MAG: helix-turn-helix transcriptional regulator, partial [Clostridiaceae bacterium]|nr:helix-turn-helix transcriptional regulator [Clostridiaceae bacterium]
MTKIDAKQTGVLIRERRQAIGWTQKQLADALFVTDKAISKWENGDGLPDISLLVQLAAALQITTDELLAGTQREMSEPVIWQKNPLAAWLATGIVFYLWLNQLVGRVSSILVNRFWFDAGPGHPREPITGLLFVLLINQVFLAGLVFVIASLPRGMKRFSRGLRVGSLVLMSCGVPLSLSHIWIDITGLLAEYGSYVLIALALFLAVWQSKRWL